MRTGQSFLERLGVLYADQVRLKIVAELSTREMSPMQFFEEVDGTSYDSVRRHFMKLVEQGWLRPVRTASTGRRGRPDQLFRATELAVIDDETWSRIPISIRDAFSVQLLEEMGDRLGGAVRSGSLEAMPNRVLEFDSVCLDELGWNEAVRAMERCFRSLGQAQIDAKVRLEISGEQPISMIVELAAFELPGRNRSSASDPLPVAPAALGPAPWTARIAKVFADPLNLLIVDALHRSTMSVSELHQAIDGESLTNFGRKCKLLAKLGWIVQVDERTGGSLRGGRERLYRATTPAVSGAEILARVPKSSDQEAWKVFQGFCGDALAAIKAGTFNARDDGHCTLSTMLVDGLGWRQVIDELMTCATRIARAQDASSKRAGGGVATRQFGTFHAGFAAPATATR